MRKSVGAALAAFCIAFATFGAEAQQARTPEREALLQQLLSVLPATHASVDDLLPGVRRGVAPLRTQVLARNSGRETDVDGVFDRYALCVATGLHAAGPSMVIEAADLSQSDAEIQEMIDFYGGPDYVRFASAIERLQRGETIPPEDSAFVQQVTGTPSAQRFTAQLQRTGSGFATSPQGSQLIQGCAITMRDEMTGAGLQGP